jgi:CheY-like chemotaxis protein
MEAGTILLVDDNPQILGILADLLRPLGHQIVSASSGAAALALATDAPPDLVLLDVMMPGMDGFTVTRQMRAHPLLAHVPIILVTALDDRESRVRGFEAGADEFVSKPFDYVELRARVSTILRLNRYRRLLDQQARLAAERARFVWAVDQSPDGVIILTPDDRVSYANPRARSLLGLALAPPDEPFPALAARRYTLVPPEAWATWPADPPDHQARFLVHPQSRAGPETWLRVELLPAPDGDAARVLSLRDVTEQISTQREVWTFQAMISHKLRTPLVSILGGLSLLNGSAGSMDRESIGRIAAVALDGARRLRSEIEDLLHYLRPPADPHGLDSPTVAELAATALQLTVDLKLADVDVRADRELAGRKLTIGRHSLEVALREVLENSVKFHPDRAPNVAVELLSGGPGELLVRVADDGPGLSAEALVRAWHPYYQGERSFTGQVEGMGLGLPLVARIVHAVGGSYAIANRPDAPGAVVTLTLPLLEG